MSVLLDISIAVPEFSVTKQDLASFYARALEDSGLPAISKKTNFLLEKTKISNRYSCIPDFDGKEHELFTNNNYEPSVEKRMEVYKAKILPLAAKSIEALLNKNKIEPSEITHLITVSCTGLFAPGLEFLVAEYFELQHTEKIALNFLGCYAAIKALKHANYIAQANPEACILIVAAELCSIHFSPSITDEDIVANLLFADGAAAAIICSDNSQMIKNKLVLNIDNIGSACIPHSADLMTWDISSSAFKMYLNKHLVQAIKSNIEPVVNGFLKERSSEIDYWAIHPGGVKIVEGVQESLQLDERQVEDSMYILKNYGNMSSPTILFILHRILLNIRSAEHRHGKSIFACAFGPGLTVEMIQLSAVDTGYTNQLKLKVKNYAVTV
jgi:alpha-pyrone synthase